MRAALLLALMLTPAVSRPPASPLPHSLNECRLNYDATRTGQNPYTGLAINHNTRREAYCAQNPTYYFCNVKAVHCTDAVEVLASYGACALDPLSLAHSRAAAPRRLPQ